MGFRREERRDTVQKGVLSGKGKKPYCRPGDGGEKLITFGKPSCICAENWKKRWEGGRGGENYLPSQEVERENSSNTTKKGER